MTIHKRISGHDWFEWISVESGSNYFCKVVALRTDYDGTWMWFRRTRVRRGWHLEYADAPIQWNAPLNMLSSVYFCPQGMQLLPNEVVMPQWGAAEFYDSIEDLEEAVWSWVV